MRADHPGPLGDDDVRTRHEMLRSRFVEAFGGPIDTRGRGAVALRFDHGLVNFARQVLPLTVARNIKVSQAHNPRNGELRENRGVLSSEIDEWVRRGHVEIWNHSASHRALSGPDDVLDEIVSSIAEIEAQVPSARGQVWGFNPPGVPGHDYRGFGKGALPEEWATEVGKTILAHHAVASGHRAGTIHRVLDGHVQDGLAHLTLDRRSVDEVTTRIDAVARTQRGLQLMLHPSRLGMEGNIAVDELAAILDHIVELRDRDLLVVLSPYELLLADAGNGRGVS